MVVLLIVVVVVDDYYYCCVVVFVVVIHLHVVDWLVVDPRSGVKVSSPEATGFIT